MSDYSVWSQLFRLNPDSPQTPMLSNQELQDELALWSNAQFQLEPMTEEPPRKKSASSSLTGSDDYQFNSNQQHVSHQQPANDTRPQQPQQPQQQAISWDFSMATTPTDIFSAISSVPPTGQQPWTPISQQPTQHHYQAEQSPVVINGVPMVPLVQMPQVQQQTKPRSISIAASGNGNASGLAKLPLLAAAPSSSQFHRPTIMPKGGIAVLSEVAAAPSITSTASQAPSTSQQRTSAKTKRPSADVSSEIALDDDVDEAEGQLEDGDPDNRVRAAEEDKRRRNTAASARFRIKKKMKEQALERTAREMTAKAEALEKRVHELETETRWLKSLITEKDPSVLSNVHCPCHHPNGLDVSSSDAAQQPAYKRPRI
ncbi:hypothetical protein LPJ53_005849 [Coemansia erecta]|uniref:BZIP domain-containing protein n=1 Tax=Coemansia erecta TaxID=147472 RepID=A0A9W7XRL5_9FUNG|nr:hypothetical protein LPJ53_005849 [Coemansia erecta]